MPKLFTSIISLPKGRGRQRIDLLKRRDPAQDFHAIGGQWGMEFDEAQRHLDPLACCIIAVEDFRSFVSTHGPAVAAQILDEVSDRIQRTIRATDIAAQFRTAEFGLLLPNTRPARALTLADRLVTEVAMRPYTKGRREIDLSVALGVGLFPSGRIRSHSELLDAASIAVARARVAGRNRVCVVQQQGYIFRPTAPGAA